MSEGSGCWRRSCCVSRGEVSLGGCAAGLTGLYGV